jgi:type I site-specific restriction-modification system R (restriction) subunit
MKMPDVEKVLFVVDRNDLDTQTSREFNAFKAESVDSTDSTHTLVKQLDQRHDKLIVTTIQKLNRAISTDRYLEHINYLKDKKWYSFLMNVIAVNLVIPIKTLKSSLAMHRCLDSREHRSLRKIVNPKQV